MKAIVKSLIQVAAIIAICSVIYCGNGSEIVNENCEISGTLDSNVSGVLVEAYPEKFVPGVSPDSVIVTSLTENGLFTLLVDTGKYNIIIRDTAGKAGAYVPQVAGGMMIENVMLAELGGIHVNVSAEKPDPYLVYIEGSPFNVIISGGHDDVIDLMPQGSYSLSILKLDDQVVSAPASELQLTVNITSSVFESVTFTP